MCIFAPFNVTMLAYASRATEEWNQIETLDVWYEVRHSTYIFTGKVTAPKLELHIIFYYRNYIKLSMIIK